jgi:hypothetical protein
MRDDAGETERLPSLGLGATVVRPVKGKSEIPGIVEPEVWVLKVPSPESWKHPGKKRSEKWFYFPSAQNFVRRRE